MPRKTPQRVRSVSRSDMSARNKNLIIIGGFALIGILVSTGTILYARTTGGQINVSAAIAASNQKFVEDGGDNSQNATPRPNANTNPTKPNGGLVGTGKSTPPPPPPTPEETGSSTATSTAQVNASSTPQETTASDEDIADDTDGALEDSVAETETDAAEEGGAEQEGAETNTDEAAEEAGSDQDI